MQSALKLSVASFLVAVALSSTLVQASGLPVCGTFKECNELKAKVAARSKELLKAIIPNLSDIVKRADGDVWRMRQHDAEKYCKGRGLRLPTPRELALYSQFLGARGLRETVYPGVTTSDPAVQTEINQMDKNGYWTIYAKNAAGKTVVDFYFNFSDYMRPAGELGDYSFWSSSFHPIDSNDAYYLSGYGGGIGSTLTAYSTNFVVRCVR